jgi:hypothetical protein
MDVQQIPRMRHLWKDARGKYVSFFACLSEVRKEIGDEALEEWCRKELLIGLVAINKAAGLLQDIDAARTKSELTSVSQAAKEKRELEAHAKRMEKVERENALAAKKVENALRKAEKEAEEKKEKRSAIAAENKRRRAEKDARDGNAVTRAKAAILANPMATRDTICKIADTIAIFYNQAIGELEGSGWVNPRAPKADDPSLYEQYVAEGKLAANSQWTMGDLAIKVSKLNTYGEGRLEKYAADIGVEYSTLGGYQSVAKAWPEICGRPQFSIASTLRTHPNRAEIFAADPYMTVAEAREIMRKYKQTTNVVELRK